MDETRTSEGTASIDTAVLAVDAPAPADDATSLVVEIATQEPAALEATAALATGVVPGGGVTVLPPAEAPVSPPPERVSTFHSFKYREYRWLWVGNTFSSAAMWVQQTTMGWVAYDLTGSGALLGVINSLRNLPPLFAAPIAGVTADRYSRNTVVAVTQALLFFNALLLAMALMYDTVHISHLIVFTLIAGTLNAFNQPARQTLVFDVVPRFAAPNAIALNSIAGNTTRTLGPAIGGALIVFFGPRTTS